MLYKFKELLLTHFLTVTIGALSAPITFIFGQIMPLLLPSAMEVIPKKMLFNLLSMLLFAIVLMFIIILLLSNETKLTPKFGFYWDKKKNPYCPVCKSLLTAYAHYNILGHGLKCMKCDPNGAITLYNDKGENISLEEARNNL